MRIDENNKNKIDELYTQIERNIFVCLFFFVLLFYFLKWIDFKLNTHLTNLIHIY